MKIALGDEFLLMPLGVCAPCLCASLTQLLPSTCVESLLAHKSSTFIKGHFQFHFWTYPNLSKSFPIYPNQTKYKQNLSKPNNTKLTPITNPSQNYPELYKLLQTYLYLSKTIKTDRNLSNPFQTHPYSENYQYITKPVQWYSSVS